MKTFSTFSLTLLALALGACASSPTSTGPALPAAEVVVAAPAAADENQAAPEDRAAFFIHHARNGECDKLGPELDAGVDINAFDRVDQTALIAALNHGHIECARVLLDRGADVNLADPAGWSPLIHAVYFGADDALIGLLLERGAQINHQNHRGVTALYLAAGIGREEQVRWLLDRGADPTIATGSGFTPLRLAQQKGLANIVKILEAQPAASTPAPAAAAAQAPAASTGS